MKKLIVLSVAVVALATIVYHFRLRLVLFAVPLLQNQLRPVAPNQPVPWQQGPAVRADKSQPRRPNIVLFVADDLGFGDLSFYRGPAAGRVDTPHIDEMARAGAHFPNAYAGNAVCAPSRASIMTGRVSTRFGFEFTPTPDLLLPIMRLIYQERAHTTLRHPIFNASAKRTVGFEAMGVPLAEVTLAQQLHAVGYHTMHIGKWHLGHSPQYMPHQRGFEESLNMEGVLCVRHIVPGLARNCIALSHIVPRLAIDSIASGTTSRARRMSSTLARILTRSTRHGFLLLAVLFMFPCSPFQSIPSLRSTPLDCAACRLRRCGRWASTP